MSKLKHKIEAILFSAGKRIKIEEIAKLANTSTSMAHETLMELREDYKNRESSLMVVDEGSAWKIIVKDDFLSVVKRIVTETELSRSVLETLAVIAFKYPIKQSDLIKVRTNKAYEHLKELEDRGYITRQKYSRSKLIKLSQKFFEYFNLPEEKLKEQFASFESIAKAIEKKETEVEQIKKDQLEKAKEEKLKDQRIKAEIDLLEEAEPSANPSENVGGLEVVAEPSDESISKENERIRQLKEEDKRLLEEKQAKKLKEDEEKAFEDKGEAAEGIVEPLGVNLSEEEEKKVNDRVKEIISQPEKKSDNGDSEGQEQKNI